jgi:putative phosphoesterase
MRRIGLLSDTHGYLDPRVFKFFADCDEVWHAGDLGTEEVAEQLAGFKPLRAVHGNIDDPRLRQLYPLDDRFVCEQLDVWITHIGGYPGRYAPRVRSALRKQPPKLFITGHSHVLRVMRDVKLSNLLHLNPGAAGKQGFHTIRTMMLFEVHGAEIKKLQAVDLGPR